ncbi:hypothetical protein DNHGIG_32330 [Collibacillus ludicampi]|uniref:NTF2-like N-terminal transpeptidase domain-containing protein n=1 Tax=Collibacillus ludicampi TaxID=2771369 RepID=A0AAV4LIM7_9BACL|nr:hypothetical protein [Collibacillus ludicampi]GIM47684.1 hypothetical protein DNHGIG_32330 [Collibacillus ludicampi]
MSKKAGFLILILGVIGGVAGQWGVSKAYQTFGASEPKKVVETYIQEQSQGHFSQAIKQLSGEAHSKVGQITNLTPDPVVQSKLEVISSGKDFCQIEATINTQKDTLIEDFYLTKGADGWKIFSIQLPDAQWSSIKSVPITDEQKQVITQYTSSLADGDGKKAVEFLAGPARIRASVSNTIPNIPKQKIIVESMEGVGKTANCGILVKVTEMIQGTASPKKETLLYTLVPVSSSWKIYDLRLIQ